MKEEEKKMLIEKYKGNSLEGTDSCLHGERLYKSCTGCGRDIK